MHVVFRLWEMFQGFFKVCKKYTDRKKNCDRKIGGYKNEVIDSRR